ncbi:hypothetical protein OG21DRAFT_1507098 [Imleria badia]|nr:hypothetical protein OG21DRAFT_1507098 [Imleria badia]
MSTPSSLRGGDDDLSEHKRLVQRAQAQIDEEINARYLPICALRTKRNALSPISRLPDELLATVFILYARQNHISEWAKVKTFSVAPAPVPPWVRVSYVCRRWRTMALGCPTLWTYVFFASRTWMTVLLRRSQMAPLRVGFDITYGTRRSLPMLEMLFEHLPRMEEFHIRGVPPDAVPNIISKLLVPAPLLQSLQLTVLSKKRPLVPLDSPTLPVILSQTTPKLQSLVLARLDIAWHSLTLTGITSLRLLTMPRPHTMQQLSSILSQMPRLMELELEDVLPWLSPFRQDPLTEQITLPCLSRLSITATIPDIVHFLSHVHIPLETEIRLKCVFGGQDSLSQLLSYVQKRLSPQEDEREGSLPKQPIRSMCIEGSPPRSFFVTCSTSECGYRYRGLTVNENPSHGQISPISYDWGRDIPLKMNVQDHLLTALTETVMVDIFQHLSLAHLQMLAVNFPEAADLSDGFWKDLFNLAPKLQFIKLRYTELRSFVTTLAPDHHGWKGQNQVLAARALEEIELEQVSFATACDADIGDEIYECDPTVHCLCDALARRRHAGYPLRRITILKSSNVGTNEVDELRGVVCEVKWDGISFEYPDPESL